MFQQIAGSEGQPGSKGNQGPIGAVGSPGQLGLMRKIGNLNCILTIFLKVQLVLLEPQEFKET